MTDIEELISLLNQRDEFAANKKINFIEAKKLKNMYETVSSKKHVMDEDEIHMFNSIKLKINSFETQLQDLKTKQLNIKQTKEQLENQINTTFDTFLSTINTRKVSLLQKVDELIQNKTQNIKSKISEYETIFDELNTIKSNTRSLLDEAISMEQIKHRKLQIENNEKSVDQIMDKITTTRIPTDTKISFLFGSETDNFLSTIGVVLDGCVPVLQDIQYDNEIPDDGSVKMLWKLPTLEEKESCKGKRKLCVEYICADVMDNDDLMDEKEWKSTQYDVDWNTSQGNVVVEMDSIGICSFRYKFYLRNNTIASPYSNIKSILLPCIDSKIITDDETLVLYRWFKEHVLTNENTKFSLSLLYRMSRDGKELAHAQSMFDGHGATITLIQARDCDNVCGGYASVSWCCATSQFDLPTKDDDAFVFLLRSQAGYEPHVFKPLDPSKAVYNRNNGGPSWGSGCTLRVYPVDRYDVYAGPDDVYNIKDDNLLLGSPACFMKDYEVHKVILY
eukprot:63059_1